MINNAIAKLQKEINEKENCINALESFNDIDLLSQLMTIQQSDLRYSQDFKLEWAKSLFANSELTFNITTNANRITFFYNDFRIKVSVASGKYISIEGNKPRHVYEPSQKQKEQLQKAINDTPVIESYLKKPSLKKFNEIQLLLNRKKRSMFATSLEYIFFRKQCIESIVMRKGYIETVIKMYENMEEERNKNIDFNIEYEEQAKAFLKAIKKDLEILMDLGFKLEIDLF